MISFMVPTKPDWSGLVLSTQNLSYNSEFVHLPSWYRPLVLKGHCPANFSSNPNQTHLNQLIKLFRITNKQQAGVFDQGWSKTLQDSGPPGPGLRTPGLDHGGEIRITAGPQKCRLNTHAP